MINVYKMINKKQNTSMKENFEEDLEKDLMSFETPETDDYTDLENSNTYTEDEFTEELNNDVAQEIDDSSSSEETIPSDEGDITKNKKLGTALVKILRDEISSKKEYKRDFLRFRYRGEICDGIPMAEINPSRFVFKIDNMLKAINLSEIKIL